MPGIIGPERRPFADRSLTNSHWEFALAHSLILLRHGQILANREGLWHGSTDSPLLARGRRQALRAGRELARREAAGDWALTAAYSSPLQRCRGTGALALTARDRQQWSAVRRLPGSLATYLGTQGAEQTALARSTCPAVVIKDELREYGIGDWEGLPFATLAKEHQFVGRAIQDPSYAPRNGESLQQVSDRMALVLRQLDAAHGPEERVLVVSHGAALAIALATLVNGDPTLWVDYPLANCSLTELRLGSAPKLLSFNGIGHLKPGWRRSPRS